MPTEYAPLNASTANAETLYSLISRSLSSALMFASSNVCDLPGDVTVDAASASDTIAPVSGVTLSV